jgi:catechol 2,3-dioxygenase-like lactoylglutathione lyase family enzyme
MLHVDPVVPGRVPPVTQGEWRADPSVMSRLPAVGQLGIVVRDMNRAVAAYQASLGVGAWYRSRMASYEVHYRGEPTAMDWDIMVGYSGALQIELIEVRDAGPNLYHELLGPEGWGFHHLGVLVRDFDRRLERARRAGFEVAQHGAIRFAGGGACRFAYLDSVSELGLILELIEMRVYGLQLGMPEWLLRLGIVTGDVERVR